MQPSPQLFWLRAAHLFLNPETGTLRCSGANSMQRPFKTNSYDGFYRQGAAYPPEFRARVVQDLIVHNGRTFQAICEQHRVSESTAHRWVRAFVDEGRWDALPRGEHSCGAFVACRRGAALLLVMSAVG